MVLRESWMFNRDTDREVFSQLLENLSNIQSIFVERDVFNELHWDFLKPVFQEWESWHSRYTLTLPQDLTVIELASIMRKVSQIDISTFFWEKDTSKEKLKSKIVWIYDVLLKKLGSHLWEDEEGSVKKWLTKYYQLFATLFWDQEASKLNKDEYRNTILSQQIQKGGMLQAWKITTIHTQEQLEELENEVWSELQRSFYKLFLEIGFWALRNMKTYTVWEMNTLEIRTNECDEVVLIERKQWLDTQERLLRDKIGITDLKRKLEKVRKEGSSDVIEKLEFEASNLILQAIFEFPYQNTNINKWYYPKGITETKEIQCVWYSLLWHAFLSELWIHHVVLEFPQHIALSVKIGKKKYLFDWTAYSAIKEMTIETQPFWNGTIPADASKVTLTNTLSK